MINIRQTLRLLIVEDNFGDFVLLKEYLHLADIPIAHIHHATSLSEVPSLLQDTAIDLAFLDLSLPDSQGIDSFNFVNQLLPGVPIIVLSGLSDEEVALETVSLGAQDYLLKNDVNKNVLKKAIYHSLERKSNLKKIQEAKERYEAVFNATHDMIWEWDFATNQVYLNKEVLFNIYGHTLPENEDFTNWWQNLTHPDDREKVLASRNKALEYKAARWEAEYRVCCMDGTYKIVLNRAQFLYDAYGNPVRMVGSLQDITQRKKMEQRLAGQAIREQRLIAETTIKAVEKQKEELGQELHDNINQILVAAKLYLGLALDREGMRIECIKTGQEHLSQAMDEIRKLAHSLVPPSLKESGLINCLSELIKSFSVSASFEISLLANGFSEDIIDDEKKLALYRVAQEQLNNIVKYAKASQVKMTLSSTDQQLIFSISDDGVGFSPEKKAKGIGLRNMAGRVGFCNGKMVIDSAPGKGCTLLVHLPLDTKL